MQRPDDMAVRFAVTDGVVTLTMDQPATRNALTPELLAGLSDGLTRATATPGARVVVLTHTGTTFCAGADLREAGTGPAAQPGAGSAAAAGLPAVLTAITSSPLPVVAQVGGHALGGGVGLVAACDISVVADTVRLGFSEVRLGVAPAVVSVVCLPKLRRGDALELFLTGERVPAARAAELGLVTRAVPADCLQKTVDEYVGLLVAGGPGALAAAKSLVYDVPGRPPAEAYEQLGELSARLFASEEAAEGRRAWRDKRPPTWAPATAGAGARP